jgi:hypothetical protein
VRAQVRSWLAALAATDPPPGALSPEGARLVWREALEALRPAALDEALARPGPGWSSMGMACPRTVPTAPLEWCAVALGRGTRVTLKVPADDPGAGALLAETAQGFGLPLVATTDRAALVEPALAVVMGSDDTVAAVRAARAGRPVLAFGHRSSVAWLTDLGSVGALSEDAARFDGRGCMSPTVVYTPLDPDEVAAALALALARSQARWPRGRLSPLEGARLRVRLGRDRVAGRLHEGAGWAVSVVSDPPDEALPRWLPVVHRARWADALRELDPAHLSTVGADDAVDVPPAARRAPFGQMQRPPLNRLHDGVDWLGLLAEPLSLR